MNRQDYFCTFATSLLFSHLCTGETLFPHIGYLKRQIIRINMKSIRFLSCLFLSCVFLCFPSCGGDAKDEPAGQDIKGTWLLVQYSYKYHYYLNGVWWDDSKSEEVNEYFIPDFGGNVSGKWWDHLTFDSHNITIGLGEYSLPTQPVASQYDRNTPKGEAEYLQALEDWFEAIGCISGDFPWVCPYSLKGDRLYIGSVYNGDVEFVGSDSFTLTYKDQSFDKDGEYKLYTYTFRRNS